MRTSIRFLALLMAAAAPLAAQGPGPAAGPMPAPAPGPMPPAARFMLAHTGELNLTDAQVVKLAAIERRAEQRRVATRASMDSLRTRMLAQGVPADSAARAARRTSVMSTLQSTRTRMEEQNKADLRDALAVLTPDQLAQAWQIVGQAGRGGMARGMRPGDMGGGMREGGMRRRMGGGMGPGMGQGMQPGQGMRPRMRPGNGMPPMGGMPQGQRPPVE